MFPGRVAELDLMLGRGQYPGEDTKQRRAA
jgi:hypothetical protein